MVRRILRTKERFNIDKEQLAHRELPERIARQGVTLVSNTGNLLPLRADAAPFIRLPREDPPPSGGRDESGDFFS